MKKKKKSKEGRGVADWLKKKREEQYNEIYSPPKKEKKGGK